MYHSKKIGVFISHIMGFYQQNVCQGIIDKALEYGYTAEIFASMDGENLGDYSLGEDSILKIPNFDEFSGVVFASTTYPQSELKEQIAITLMQKCSCPVIDITENNDIFPSITLENSSTTRELVRHLISVHGDKRICYLGCESESYFSDSRENYYREAMAEAGLTVGPNDIYTAVYTPESVTNALKHFTANGSELDAVVCYNDHMALLFMEAALQNGYKIPENFAITGCDHSEEGQNVTPCLTSVSFPVYELGAAAVECLIKKIKGEDIPLHTQVPAHIVIGDSCGCHASENKNSIFYQRALLNRIADTEDSIFTSMRMSATFQNITDIDDGMDLLESYIQSIAHCHEFYLCLYDGWDSISSHILELTDQSEDIISADEIHLKLAIRDGKRLPECSFAKNTLLPEHIYRHSDAAYLYMPLFFKNKEFGYVALSYEHNRINYHLRFVHWFMNINQMLQRICDAKNTNVLVTHLEDIYTKDALTGLLNKHGYMHHEDLMIEDAIACGKTLTGFIFDMNGLKYINDTFGHNEGDFAIQVIGHALSSTTRSGDICARFSGDEFYMLSSNYTEEEANDLLARVHKYLSNYNKLSHKEYQISASGGFAQATPQPGFSKEDLKELYAKADKEMYMQKREAHGARE